MRTAATIIIIIGLVAAAWFLFWSIESEEGSGAAADVPIQEQFEGKIVYTTDLGVDKAPLVEHCEAQGGEFNDCGSVCAPGEDVCASVCAYTCELDQ